MRTCAECILCLLQRDLKAVPKTAGMELKARYQREVLGMIAGCDPDFCTAQISARVDAIYRQYFGERKTLDFAALKAQYNSRMLALEPALRALVCRAQDPLRYAIQLARAGNYIDFAAGHEVQDQLLDALLQEADQEALDAAEYALFCEQLPLAERIVYLTDNAGEIVLDKLLIEVLMARFPQANFTVMVRGAPTLNDATLEDAAAVGLTELVDTMGNGNALAGTVLAECSLQAQTVLREADVIIAKGQANFETLHGCGYNIYYLFLCKCEYFVRRFQVPQHTGMFVNERRLPALET